MRELESFILEIGVGFTFVARQKRITVDHEDYYLDLLFYHRKLRRLVAIELKLDKFKAAHKGQMELYLRWLEKYEKQPQEKSPIGLILCADKSEEHVRLLQLSKSGIRVAAYLTELPPRKLLQQKLHEAIMLASAHPEMNLTTLGTGVSFQFRNEQFFARSRTIPQDSGIGQPSGCPQGREAWKPRVNSRDCAETYVGTSHKRSRRLTPRLRKRAISGWTLAKARLERGELPATSEGQ